MKKIIYGALLLFLISGTTNAIEECRDREDGTCVILAFTVNKTNVSQILTGQICNITIRNDSGGLLVDNMAMTNGSYGQGYHNWTFNYSNAGIHSSTISCQTATEYGTGSIVITAVNKTLDTKADEIVPAVQSVNDTVKINNTRIYDYLTTEITDSIQSVNRTCKTQPEDNPGWIFSLPSYSISPMILQQNGSQTYNQMREMWSFERSYSRN